eukprot:PRCOL_00000437-RA
MSDPPPAKLLVPEDVLGVDWEDLLVGPREMHKKHLEAETGCKVTLQGGLGEPLCVVIEADSGLNVSEGVAKVRDLLFDEDIRNETIAAHRRTLAAIQGQGGAAAGFATTTLRPLAADSEYTTYLDDPNATKVIKVPSASVGKVIGRGGEVIRMLQDTTGCRIQIRKDEENERSETGVEMRPIELTGSDKAVAAAERMIMAEINNQAGPGGGPGLGLPRSAQRNPGDEELVMRVPNGKVGTIIGKGGETIKLLQDRSGARIQVQPDRETAPGSTERVVTLSGNAACIKEAQRLVTDVVNAPDARAAHAIAQGAPPGGAPGVDAKTGTTYYYNVSTNTTQWEKPQ